MHWADRRASVAVPDSLSDARMAGIGAFQSSPLSARVDGSCPIPDSSDLHHGLPLHTTGSSLTSRPCAALE